MSFLDEVNSLKQKAGISKPNLALVIGIGVLALGVLVFGAFQLWTAFSVPDAAFIQEETVQGESQDQVEQQSSETRSETNKSTIYVHITGEVVSPGMYQLPGGSRVSQANRLLLPQNKCRQTLKIREVIPPLPMINLLVRQFKK